MLNHLPLLVKQNRSPQTTNYKPLKNNPMKTKSLFLAFLIISLSCINLSAQTSKGKFLVGGLTYIGNFGSVPTGEMNIGYTTTQSKDDSGDDSDYKRKQFSINLLPKVGYFVIDNLAVGLDFTLSSSFRKTTNLSSKSKSTVFTAGPFVRYYIPTKKVLPFAEANYSFGSNSSSSEWEGEESSSKYGIQMYGVGIGVGFPLGEKVSFDTVVGYHHFMIKRKEDNDNNDRTVSGTVGLKLGFTILLGSN